MAISSAGVAGLKPGVVDNAAARPSSPFEGQAIYQKDTDEVLYYNGTAWAKAWNMPRGVMGYVVRTSGNTTLSTSIADVTGASITYTAEAGRAYLITFSSTLNKPSAGYIEMQLTDASNNLIADTIQSVSNSFAILNFSFLQIGNTAGSKTVKARAATDAGVGTVYGSSGNPYSFIVQDIGPA